MWFQHSVHTDEKAWNRSGRVIDDAIIFVIPTSPKSSLDNDISQSLLSYNSKVRLSQKRVLSRSPYFMQAHNTKARIRHWHDNKEALVFLGLRREDYVRLEDRENDKIILHVHEFQVGKLDIALFDFFIAPLLGR